MQMSSLVTIGDDGDEQVAKEDARDDSVRDQDYNPECVESIVDIWWEPHVLQCVQDIILRLIRKGYSIQGS